MVVCAFHSLCLGKITNPIMMALDFLFLPSDPLKRALVGYKQKWHLGVKPVIGIHVRLGNQNPEFNDQKRHTLEQIPLFVQCASHIEEYFHLPNSTRWLVAADSPRGFQEILKYSPPHKVISVQPPVIIHTEKTVGYKARENMLFVFLEQMLLARTDYLILSHSGYGTIASAWGDVKGPFDFKTCNSFVDAASQIDHARERHSIDRIE
ncbi:hypothetical protein CYMTET_46256 [Cymbomonas tetramitiformis]|uniref:Uncharacterized protein n=1 Tax=Cymbomonas tetramitiformis TaxID=36881 RepID=A0AAE0BWI9_9CHLO|nr:hypothetical protein CYMTET_46256 [Cymbomonas tetramitiformis]